MTLWTICLTVFTGLLMLTTLLPLSRNGHWLVRGFDFPRVQLASLLALMISALALTFYTQATQSVLLPCLIALNVGALVWQLWWVLPYTTMWQTEVNSADSDAVDSTMSIKILTSNVLGSNRQSDKLIALVNQHQPDILITLESNAWWEAQLSELEGTMPFTVKCPLENLYGMHVYSRLPLHQPEVKYLVQDNVPSVHALIELESGHRIKTHFLHPAPPSPTENETSTARDVELIIVAKSLENESGPIIVTGDLNDVAWSKTTRLFRKVSGLLDPRIGRGMFNTFHADYPFARWPLDHIFHSHHFEFISIQRLPSIGSDHFPLLSELVLIPSDSRVADDTTQSNSVDKTASDRQEADDITDQRSATKSDVPTK